VQISRVAKNLKILRMKTFCILWLSVQPPFRFLATVSTTVWAAALTGEPVTDNIQVRPHWAQLALTTDELHSITITMVAHMTHQPMAVLESGLVNRWLQLTRLGSTGSLVFCRLIALIKCTKYCKLYFKRANLMAKNLVLNWNLKILRLWEFTLKSFTPNNSNKYKVNRDNTKISAKCTITAQLIQFYVQ